MPEQQPSRAIPAVPHLIAASVISTVAIVALVVDGLTPADIIPEWAQGILLAVPIIMWCTYRSRCAEERVIRRVDERHDALLKAIEQRLDNSAAAEAYVDGLMRRDPGERVLRSV